MNKFLKILFFLFFISTFCFAQNIETLKKNKQKSEKEIEYLNKLLKEAKKDKYVSLNKLSLLKRKIKSGKSLQNSLNKEVNVFESMISSNQIKIDELLRQKNNMLILYSKLIYTNWKTSKSTSSLYFLLSSDNFKQAYRRYRYLMQIKDYSELQLNYILNINDSLEIVNSSLNSLISKKNISLNKIDKNNRDLELQQLTHDKYIKKLRQKESSINRKLKLENSNRKKFEIELKKLIASEVKKSGGSKKGKYILTHNEKILSDKFILNRGKLPWPVKQGIITEHFGTNIQESHHFVRLNNDGINITTSKNADVYSIFKGKVTSVLLVPGSNNTVIIRHGNYLTVYVNLSKVTVRKDDYVSTGQKIGTIAFDNEKGSVLKFQLWKDFNKYDPENWLAK